MLRALVTHTEILDDPPVTGIVIIMQSLIPVGK